MLDEVWVYARLDSPLFGGLVHAVELARLATQADAAAGRIYDAPPKVPDRYVNPARLGLPHGVELALQDWPLEKGSLFTFLHEHDCRDGIFRPRELVDETTYARSRFYRPLDAHCRITDAVAVCFELPGSMWCALSLLRCNGSRAFSETHLAALERFKPALARTLTRAVGTDRRRDGGDTLADRRVPMHRPSPAELLARLSRTERQVLNYLRSDLTERQVAEQMHRSPHTVHVHVKNIYCKLGVSSRKALLGLFERG